MKSDLSIAVLLAFPCVVGASPAQNPPCIEPVPVSLPWPGELPVDGTGLSLAAVGDFDGDATGDVLWLVDGEAVLAPKPAMYQVSMPAQGGGVPLDGVTGLATAPTALGQKDKLYASGAAGLERWTFTDYSDGDAAFLRESIETSVWVDATHLHAADFDGAGGVDVVGINAAESAVLVVRDLGTGFSTTQQIPFSASQVWDVSPIDWLGTGLDCLAILTGAGLAIVEPALPSPRVLALYPTEKATAGVLTTLRRANGDEFVAWARAQSGTDPHIVLRGPGDLGGDPIAIDLPTCEFPSLTSHPMPFAMEACDYDLAGGEDLVLALPSGSSTTMAVLKNDDGTFSMASTSDYDVAILDMPYGHPGVGQLDDGPKDVALPLLDGSVDVFVALPYVYSLMPGPPTSRDILLESCEWALISEFSQEEERQLHMAFRIPTDYSWATDIEVMLWYLDDPEWDEQEEEFLAPFIDSRVIQQKHELLTTTTDQWVVVGGMAEGLSWPIRHHYFVEYRFREEDENQLLQVSRWFSAGFTLCSDGELKFVEGVDDVFLEHVIGAEEYEYGEGIEINAKSVLNGLEPGDTGAVHGLFHPAATPPIDPMGFPRPATIVVGPGAQALPFN